MHAMSHEASLALVQQTTLKNCSPAINRGISGGQKSLVPQASCTDPGATTKLINPGQLDSLKNCSQQIESDDLHRMKSQRNSQLHCLNLMDLNQRVHLLADKVEAINTEEDSTSSNQNQLIFGGCYSEHSNNIFPRPQNMSPPLYRHPSKTDVDSRQQQPSNVLENNLPHRRQRSIDKAGCFKKTKKTNQVRSNSNYRLHQGKRLLRESTSTNYNRSFDSNKSNNQSTPLDSSQSKLRDLRLHIRKSEQQMHQMAKQLARVKLKTSKSESMKSICLDRLSQTKRSLSKFKKITSGNQKVILKLERELKKSETIREKQRETIFKQKSEINQLRKTITHLTKALKI